MEARRELEVPLRDPDRGRTGTLRLRVPPDGDTSGPRPPLVDASDDPERATDVPPIQLLESGEYLYEVHVDRDGSGPLTLKPGKFFSPDDEDGSHGRLRPGLHTGELPVTVDAGGRTIGRARLEVRSRKLRYRQHYRWMLGDLADGMAELVMQRFAPTRQRFELREELEAPTLYQRFAFLRSLVESQVFDGAIQQVVRRPYRTWVKEEEWRRPGRGVPAGSDVARQIAGPGPRVDAGHLQETLGVETVPRSLRVRRTAETRDNVPNRFVRFALERWRDVVSRIRDLLAVAPSSGPVERGLRECDALRDRLDAALGREVFRACGPLESFPAGNQVLQKREGYRDIFRAYVQFEAAARLSWSGGEDVYGAGQRDVATLFEYWAFYALSREISELCDEPFDLAELVEPADGGLTLRLRKGRRRVLSGTVRRLGRTLDVELWFNRTFQSDGDEPRERESWTSRMRPDLSVRVRPSESNAGFFHEEVWLHFDAKYRLDRLEQALGEKDGHDEEIEASADAGEAKRADLLRMHAYRDAIRRSSGAYILYPGTAPDIHREFHEVLPGLGAFPLRPVRSGRPGGASRIRSFMDEILDQVALQTSSHERARYWSAKSYDGDSKREHGEGKRRSEPSTGSEEAPVPEAPRPRVRAASFLEEPPADARVLLGYVKSQDHYLWIRREGLYNLRGDDRTGSVDVGSDELGVRWIVLYGRPRNLPEVRSVAGEPRVMDRGDMRERRYPRPGSDLYFCLPVGPRRSYEPLEDRTLKQIKEFHQDRTGGPRGLPLVVTWKELAEKLV